MILGIYGAGGSGRELEELISEYAELNQKWNKLVFIDDTAEEGELRNQQRMPFELFKNKYSPQIAKITIAVGEPAGRKLLNDRVTSAGYSLATIISPNSRISPYAHIGDGVVIQDYSFISSDAKISNNVWIQTHAIIGHDVYIKDNCQISSEVFIGGRSIIEENVYIGACASVREDTIVAHDAIVSMGAVVLKNVTAERICMGNPAREIANNNEKRVFR